MKKKIRIAVNICIAVIVAAAWIGMFNSAEGVLTSGGFTNLKYFTVLSNLLEGAASVIWIVSQIRNGEVSDGAERLKYVAATAVALTLATVIFFLGPLYGFTYMFVGANLFFHLLIPLAAILEILFLTDKTFDRRDNLIACIPTVAYGVFYIGNVVINGVGEWPDTNDWYLFLAWGYPVGILIFAGLAAATWLLALLMRKAQLSARKKKKSVSEEE